VERKKVDWLPSGVQWTENIDDVLSSDAHIVVEVMGGLQPAKTGFGARSSRANPWSPPQAVDRPLRPELIASPAREISKSNLARRSPRRARDLRLAGGIGWR